MLDKISAYLNPQYIIIVGGLITLFGTYLAYLKNKLDSDKTENKITETLSLTKKVHHLTNVIDTAQIELKYKQEKIEELQDKNFQLSQKISSKALEIADYVSSKDSYVFASLVDLNEDKTLTSLILTGTGKHPLKVYDIRIYDLNLNKDLFSNHYDLTVFPDYGVSVPAKIPINLNQELKWNIFFETSNGHLVEHLRLKYVNHKYISSIKVFSMENTEKAIYQNISKDFDKY